MYPFLYIYAMAGVFLGTKIGRYAMLFQVETVCKNGVLDKEKTALRCLLDAIMLLTFFDAVVIAIRTCCYRDDNMMLSTCVHVVIKLATCCQFEGASF